ncbi:hypothetical protein GCM10023311_13700 [Flaviramulus aquimarinus]|uniref:Uncharacterized protein n=1 Tax=Flaviramulus aquimarinus TaxID=1170456 RepID=A0ABP9F8R6_9FLAO
MKISYIAVLFLICLSFVAFQCDEDHLNLTFDEEQAKLNVLKSQIEDLASTSTCNEASECKFIGLGRKSCGGLWNYLVYSTSIDTEALKSLVEIYNQKEKEFNTKWGIASDCAVTNPPTSINCKNNVCVAVY